MTRHEADEPGREARQGSLLRGSWVPICLVLGSALFLGFDVATPAPELHAAASAAPDTDGDGLVDVVERLLGTRVRSADTDGDGISDAEEVARGSSPRHSHSHPRQRPVDVGIIAHSHDATVHVEMFVYAADGELRGKDLMVTAVAGEDGRLFSVPARSLARLSGMRSFEASDGGRVFVLDLPIHARTIYAAQTVSVAATVAAVSTREPGSADVLDLVTVDGVICQRIEGERVMAATALPGTGGNELTIDATGQSQDSGSIFLPIFNPGTTGGGQGAGTGTNASTSSPGQICVQQTVAVGTSGGSIVQEVVSAECVDGWDGYCASSCPASVGSRIRTIDPITYSGG